MLPGIIEKYKIEPAYTAYGTTDNIKAASKTVFNTLSTYDIYGDSYEFTSDVSAKFYGIFINPTGLAEEVTELLRKLEDTSVSQWTSSNKIISFGNRQMTEGDAELCKSMGGTGTWSYRNRELDAIIDETISRYNLSGVAEICNMRCDTYFDNIMSNYTPIRTTDNIDYTPYCFYGGSQLKLDADYGRRLIIVNIHGLSLIMILAIYNMVCSRNSAPIIILSRWDYINKNGKMLTDMSCNVYGKLADNCGPLFINRVNFD